MSENKPADFLTDPENASEDESYIVPNVELKLPAHKRQECREIVMEIKKFGISQRQLLYLIQLLSFELEDNNIMKSLVKVIGENREKIKISNIITE